MSQQVGTVTAVQSVRRGVIATSWVGTQMSVVNAADLDREGGTLSPDDGATLYGYTSVVDGASELDPDVVTMADEAPADWPVETVDPDTGETIPAEVRLDVWPERLDVTAMVDLGDGETVPCVVPHALRPLLVDGVREDGAGETVRIQRVDMEWQVADVLGRRAQLPMESLASEVVQAIESASAAGMTRWDAVTEPTQDGHAAGDMWWRHDGTVSGHVIGQWHWDGSAWIADTLDGAVLANLDAGTITAGALSGIGVFSPSSTATPRIEINGSTLQIVRAITDSDGTTTGERVATVLGGDTADQLQFYDADNKILGGFDPDGVMTSQSVLTNSISIAGADILDIAQQAPQGIISGHNFTSTINNLRQTESAIVDLQFTAVPGRTYQFQVNNSFDIPKTGRLILYFRPLLGTNGSDTVGKPPLTTPAVGYGIFSPAAYYSANYAQQVTFTYLWQPTGITQPTACRVMLSALFQGSGSASLVGATGGFFVNDMGSTYTGIFADGNFDAIPVKTFQNDYVNGINSATWIDGVLEVRPGDHGRYLSQGATWARNGTWTGGSQSYTNVWFPQTIRDDLAGAQTIASIWVGVTASTSTWPEGFVPRIARSAAPWNDGAPSASVPSATEEFDAVRIPNGGTAWVRLPPAWYPGIASGAIKSIQFGTRAGTNHKYAGVFGYSGGSYTPFRARYTK